MFCHKCGKEIETGTKFCINCGTETAETKTNTEIAAVATPTPAAAEDNTKYDVILESTGVQKVKVISAVRQLSGLGLAESKNLVDSAPNLLESGVTKAEGERIREMLSKAGATVILRVISAHQKIDGTQKNDCKEYLNRYISQEFSFRTVDAFISGYVPQDMKVYRATKSVATFLPFVTSLIWLIWWIKGCSPDINYIDWNEVLIFTILIFVSWLIPKIISMCLRIWIKDKNRTASHKIYTISTKIASISRLTKFLSDILYDYGFSKTYCTIETNTICLDTDKIIFEQNLSEYKLDMSFDVTDSAWVRNVVKKGDMVSEMQKRERYLYAPILQAAIEYYARTQQ